MWYESNRQENVAGLTDVTGIKEKRKRNTEESKMAGDMRKISCVYQGLEKQDRKIHGAIREQHGYTGQE